MTQKIGIYGSCQLKVGFNFFVSYPTKKLNYEIFDKVDIIIIEINNLKNQACSTTIIEYIKENRKIRWY